MKEEKEKWYAVSSEENENFLAYAKELGCRWISGKEIDSKQDKCSTFMCVCGGVLSKIPFVNYVMNHYKHVVTSFAGGAR